MDLECRYLERGSFGKACSKRSHPIIALTLIEIWDLFEAKRLFQARDDNGDDCPTSCVAEMVGYLGPPPLDFIKKSEIAMRAFNEQGQSGEIRFDLHGLTCVGNWNNCGGVTVPSTSLEGAVSAVEGEDKEVFLKFIRSMLEWAPEKRKRAYELLKDPWLESGLPAESSEP